jgi:hypothetical protein
VRLVSHGKAKGEEEDEDVVYQGSDGKGREEQEQVHSIKRCYSVRNGQRGVFLVSRTDRNDGRLLRVIIAFGENVMNSRT